MFRISLTAAIAATLATGASADIEVHDAYARSSTPAAGAAFMTIHNHGGPDDRLIEARSDAAARVELHTSLQEDGVMRMVPVEEGLELPSDGEIVMERGSYHVMMMGLTQPWETGDIIEVTLVFEGGMELPLEIEVDNERMPGEGMDHGAMDHDSN